MEYGHARLLFPEERANGHDLVEFPPAPGPDTGEYEVTVYNGDRILLRLNIPAGQSLRWVAEPGQQLNQITQFTIEALR